MTKKTAPKVEDETPPLATELGSDAPPAEMKTAPPGGIVGGFLERWATVITPDVPPQPAPQPPSLGRIVIYTSAGEKGHVGELHAAVITAIEGDTVSLRVWTRTAEFPVMAARFTDCAPGSVEAQGRWAWPPRV